MSTEPDNSVSWLLWRTAGKDWDYEFIARPAASVGWYDFWKWVFPTGGPDDAGSCGRRGVVPIQRGTMLEDSRFWAMSFRDPGGRTDTQGRPINHFVVVLYDEHDTAHSEVRGTDPVRAIWPQIERAFAGVYDDRGPGRMPSLTPARQDVVARSVGDSPPHLPRHMLASATDTGRYTPQKKKTPRANATKRRAACVPKRGQTVTFLLLALIAALVVVAWLISL